MKKKSRGFTLLEVIAILVVGGIVAALLVPFMSSAVVDSHRPLDNLRSSSGISSDMARVVAEHRSDWNPVPPRCDALEEDINNFVEENGNEWNAELADDSPNICGFSANTDGYSLDCSPSVDPEILEVTLQVMNKQSGFTLVELIATITLLGIVSVFGGMFLVQIVQSQQWASDNYHLAQKTQVAMTRISNELQTAERFGYNCRRGNALMYTTNTGDEVTISRDNSTLVYQTNSSSYTLADGVLDFEVEYSSNGVCEIALQISGANDAPQNFSFAVAPTHLSEP